MRRSFVFLTYLFNNLLFIYFFLSIYLSIYHYVPFQTFIFQDNYTDLHTQPSVHSLLLKLMLFSPWLPLTRGQHLVGNVDIRAWEVSPFVTSPDASISRAACFHAPFSEKCSEQKERKEGLFSFR